MELVLNATYKNGALILDKKLADEKEDKKYKIILFEQDSNMTKKESFCKLMEKHSFKLPKDYKFNREKLHE